MSAGPGFPLKRLAEAALASLLLLTPNRGLAADSPSLASFAPADPLRIASLTPRTDEGEAPPEGDWRITTEAAYFNLWYGSWHPATIHQEFGLVGQPLQSWELRTLEQRHGDDEIFQVDLEGRMGELRVARGLPLGLGLVISVPWVEVGRPHWDAISQDLHRALGWTTGDRDIFPHGGTLVYLWSARQHRSIESREEIAGASLGDLSVALSGPLGGWAGGEHRWVVALEAPTGTRGTLAGSGGWDLGVRWYGTWTGRRTRFRLGAAADRLDRSGDFLGIERDDTWHLLADGAVRVAGRSSLQLSCRWDSSPLTSFTEALPGDPALFITLAWRRTLTKGGWVAVALGENLPPNGVAPDFSLHLQLGF